MLNPAQQACLAQKCANALNRAVDSLPGLLKRNEPEEAALIVADLLKALLNIPSPQPDPGAALQEVFDRARRKLEAAHAEEERTQQ